jgi:uncharacterized protein Usg
LPFSSRAPGPTATTSPSIGFSLAVSGMMMPPLVLNDYRITTAEILYWMPDHKHVLQSFVWQNLDLAPRFPALTKFLDFWEHHLDGKVHRVRVANAQFVKPAEFRFASGLYALH